MPSSEPFLSSSELEEVVLEETWYFLFTVMGMLQLSRYLKIKKKPRQLSITLHPTRLNLSQAVNSDPRCYLMTLSRQLIC